MVPFLPIYPVPIVEGMQRCVAACHLSSRTVRDDISCQNSCKIKAMDELHRQEDVQLVLLVHKQIKFDPKTSPLTTAAKNGNHVRVTELLKTGLFDVDHVLKTIVYTFGTEFFFDPPEFFEEDPRFDYSKVMNVLTDYVKAMLDSKK